MRDFHEFLADTSESNARKRAVWAALRGTGPDLPGSSAACPSTIPAAMDVADEKGVVTKWTKHKKKKEKKDKGDDDKEDDRSESVQTEGKVKIPDYSADKVITGAERLKDVLKKSLDDFGNKNKELDKTKATEEKKSDQLKKQLEKDDKTAQASEPKKPEHWKQFKDKKEGSWKKDSNTGKPEEKK